MLLKREIGLPLACVDERGAGLFVSFLNDPPSGKAGANGESPLPLTGGGNGAPFLPFTKGAGGNGPLPLMGGNVPNLPMGGGSGPLFAPVIGGGGGGGGRDEPCGPVLRGAPERGPKVGTTFSLSGCAGLNLPGANGGCGRGDTPFPFSCDNPSLLGGVEEKGGGGGGGGGPVRGWAPFLKDIPGSGPKAGANFSPKRLGSFAFPKVDGCPRGRGGAGDCPLSPNGAAPLFFSWFEMGGRGGGGKLELAEPLLKEDPRVGGARGNASLLPKGRGVGMYLPGARGGGGGGGGRFGSLGPFLNVVSFLNGIKGNASLPPGTKGVDLYCPGANGGGGGGGIGPGPPGPFLRAVPLRGVNGTPLLPDARDSGSNFPAPGGGGGGGGVGVALLDPALNDP